MTDQKKQDSNRPNDRPSDDRMNQGDRTQPNKDTDKQPQTDRPSGGDVGGSQPGKNK